MLLGLIASTCIVTPRNMRQDNSAPKDWTLPLNKNWHWAPVKYEFSDLPKRLTFRAPTPRTLSGGYKLLEIEALWIPLTAYQEAPFPPHNRQLIHLRYVNANDVIDALLSKKEIQTPGWFVHWAYNAQCFVTPRRQYDGTGKDGLGLVNWVYGQDRYSVCIMLSKNSRGAIMYDLRDELMGSPKHARPGQK